jgi:hypothetical protein
VELQATLEDLYNGRDLEVTFGFIVKLNSGRCFRGDKFFARTAEERVLKTPMMFPNALSAAAVV